MEVPNIARQDLASETLIDTGELSVLVSSLGRSVEDRLESNTSAISAALEMRRNLQQ